VTSHTQKNRNPALTASKETTRLPADRLRWRCDPAHFSFGTTAESEGAKGIVAQPAAIDALEYSIATRARGQNAYVRGQRGTGRMTMVRQVLASVEREPSNSHDYCYVHNFRRPDRPRLVALPAEQGRLFSKQMNGLADIIQRDLPAALESELVTDQRIAIEERVRLKIAEISEPLEQELRRDGMALVPIEQGPISRTVIFPLVEGEPVPPAQLRKLVREGKVTKERLEHFEAHYQDSQKRLQSVSSELAELQREGFQSMQSLVETAARDFLEDFTESIKHRFPVQSVAAWLEELVDDVIATRLRAGESAPDPQHRYSVNIVHESAVGRPAPVVEEHAPNLVNLLGTVDVNWGNQGPVPADFSGIRGGALLRADGGFLVLDIDDLLAEPGSWRALMRTLRTGELEIVPPELGFMRPQLLVSPEPIPVSVRVILVGDAGAYFRLDMMDPDFGELFKVLADFDDQMDRDQNGIQQYARVITSIAQAEGLKPFDAGGVAALVEHGARIAASRGKLTSRFGRLADIAREASFLAEQADAPCTAGEHVDQAIVRTKQRAGMPSRKFQELIKAGTIRIATSGSVVGQINGLAVIGAGPVTYGFPARITATIGPGRAGLINIEGQASMSGSIHTKGFHILGGLLRYLLRVEHPLAFSASLAFEQSYGGIDGDSASGAEICCLLSALTDVPISQDFAMTGAIDQHGHIQAIGGVNEKIEGYFDACEHFGLTGTQGVIIPAANAGDLMLRRDVVAACEAGQFHIHAVETVHQALEVLTCESAGEYGEAGYPPESLLGRAVEQATDFWRKTLASPEKLAVVARQEAPET
jgi:ATP-dependent Lon protease